MSGSIKTLLVVIALVAFAAVLLMVSAQVASALLLCATLAVAVGVVIGRDKGDPKYLLGVFVSGLLVRIAVGSAIYALDLHEFFGGDALYYDESGYALLKLWQGESDFKEFLGNEETGWGMFYLVAGIYALVGRNMLALQYVNAVIGAATAVVVYLCARQMFQNRRVARLSAVLVALYPSIVLWSAQGLKDGPIVFVLSLAMLATLHLGEKFSAKYVAVLAAALFGAFSLRFYIFYMLVVAVVGSFFIGIGRVTVIGMVRNFAIVVIVGLAMTYLGVLRTASVQVETFSDLRRVQRTRDDLAKSAQSGFGRDVDVSTTGGALSVIPLGATYLLFAPFPWQMANLRQSITLPEMLVWWSCFPLLILGLWFAVKYRLRATLPILLFTSMLTLAYSIFQGNIGTAYRQRSQLLIFYFIFVAVGYELLKEWREDRKRAQAALTARYPHRRERVA